MKGLFPIVPTLRWHFLTLLQADSTKFPAGFRVFLFLGREKWQENLQLLHVEPVGMQTFYSIGRGLSSSPPTKGLLRYCLGRWSIRAAELDWRPRSFLARRGGRFFSIFFFAAVVFFSRRGKVVEGSQGLAIRPGRGFLTYFARCRFHFEAFPANRTETQVCSL